MKDLSTKEQILDQLDHAEGDLLAQANDSTTNEICRTNHISRSLASQYLNALHKEGKLVKVTSRPVYYFSTSALRKRYQASIYDYEFYDLDELRLYLEKKAGAQHDFHKVIGSTGTLSYCIMQMKAAMRYPPNGLPVILQGRKGSGKAFLAEAMFEFCQYEEIIEGKARFIKDYISDSDVNYDMILFGSVQDGIKTDGLLEQANHGLLYIANAAMLSPSTQRRLADYMKNGYFYHNNCQSTMIESKTRIVLGIEEGSQLHEDLRLNFPVMCEIPPFSARTHGEKEEMIIACLHQEMKHLHKPIQCSKVLYQALIHCNFNDSIHDMYTNLKMLCANAYAEYKHADSIIMYLRHAPITLLQFVDVKQQMNHQEDIIDLSNLQTQHGNRQILALYEEILQAHKEYLNKIQDEHNWLANGFNSMRAYYDFIVFDQQEDHAGMRSVCDKLEELINAVEKQNEITLPLNCGFILARIVHAIYRTNGEVQLWEHQRQTETQLCLHTLEIQFPSIYAMACAIIDRINYVMDVKLGVMNTIFLILNIHFYNRDVINRDTCAVIISHGYSTATSIADATNQLLQTHVCKAIDMPLDVDVHQIQKKLLRFIQLYPYYRNLIIMVDMGSLEELAVKLQTDMNIGIINNISTGLALDIGNRILQHQGLAMILQNACTNYECHYQIITNRHKEKTIVFTSDAGIKVAEKLVELFRNSLPKTIHLRFISYDYDHLYAMGMDDILFSNYDVILLIKPNMLKLPELHSLSLEDLINVNGLHDVNEILSQYLNEEEIEAFNQELIKNFSLQSIMENLTILNPRRLLDQVSEAITQLQHEMKRRFQNKTIIGIYMHTCFLIERLVTKTAILSDNMDTFVLHHQDFIDVVRISFEKMLENYGVEIPISEISYLYDYIENENWEES